MCATTFPIMLATRELLLETVINITASSQHKHIVNVTQLHQLAYSIVGEISYHVSNHMSDCMRAYLTPCLNRCVIVFIGAYI